MQVVKAELLLLDLSEEESEDVSDKVELEAAMIAEKIQNMLKHGKVFDKTTGELRPARLGDMVILLRSMTGWSDTFANVLGAYEPMNLSRIAGRRVLLLDDIITTGATAGECAKVLQTAGAAQVQFAAIAAANKKSNR